MKRTIRESVHNEFDTKMRRFSKRFAKFDYSVEWTFSRPRIATYYVDDHNCITPPPIGQEVKVEVTDVEIKFFREGMEQDIQHCLQVKDSKVIGHVDYLSSEDGEVASIVKSYTGVEIDKLFRTRQYCDHCHTNRRRNRTYIVIDKDAQYQVGSTCVEVYFGVPVPFIEIFAEFSVIFGDDEEEVYGGYRGLNGYNCTEFISLCVGCILKSGYVNRDKAEREERMKTGNLVAFCKDQANNSFIKAEERKSNLDALNEWKELAVPYMERIDADIEKITESEEELDNFTYSCSQMIKADFIPFSYENYIAGFICRILNGIRKTEERANSKHLIGEIGDRVTFEGKVTMVKAIDVVQYQWNSSQTKYLIVFRTKNDETVKTFYSGRDNFEVDEEVTVTGTIREHCDNQYGIATMVNRIRRM